METEKIPQNQQPESKDPEILEIRELIDKGDLKELEKKRNMLMTLRIQLMQSIDAIKVAAPKGDKDLQQKEEQLEKWNNQFNLIMKGIKKLTSSNPEG